jgi:stearoyl-CoA desaturase (delta-9 desaturase)
VERAPLPRRPFVWLNVWFLTVFPVLAIGGAVAYGLTVGITWREVLAALLFWVLTGLGITAGYHRLFSHRGYKAHAVVRFFYAVLGAAAIQNSVIAWCSDHRFHHKETDTDGDPYDATRGFWYSHMGWILVKGLRADRYDNVDDLRRDPILAWQDRNYLAVAIVTNFLLAGIGGLLFGRLLGMFLIAVVLRIVVVQHATFLVNSAAHKWGWQPWSKETTSRDNWFLSLFTLGEGYHNYHHRFQADYRNGPRWYNWDPTKWAIWGLSRVGLASDLHRIPVDVMLSARFEESSRSFVERLGSWGEHRTAEWRTLLRKKREEMRRVSDPLLPRLREGGSDLRERLLAAHARMDQRLQELKVSRAAHVESVKRASGEKSRDARRLAEQEMRRLHRVLQDAQRSAKATMKGWERLTREYLANLPAPCPA